MSQIVSDSRFDNLPFGLVDSDAIDTIDDFEPYKSAERAIDVVTLTGFFSDLTVLDTT